LAHVSIHSLSIVAGPGHAAAASTMLSGEKRNFETADRTMQKTGDQQHGARTCTGDEEQLLLF